MEIPKELAGRFIVGEKIAERPSCHVFRGVDKELGDRPVAIKIFADRPNDKHEWIEAFEKEVSILRAASHPCLVPIISGGHDRGWFYIAMELMEGKTLRDYLKGIQAPIETAAAIEMISQICAGLKEIHEKSGYHGHIDPRAIFFKGDDVRLAGYYPHVLNEIEKQTTATGRLTVDTAYIAPDQISGAGSVDGRADIYAVSLLLYEMLTGERPFKGDNPMQLAMVRMAKDPEPPRKLNPSIPPLIDAAIMRALSRDKNQRFANVEEFVDALTGGKKPTKNPLLEAMGPEGERLGNTQTIAVSMSTDAIKHILRAHESQKPKAVPQAVTASSTMLAEDISVMGTQTEQKAVDTISGAATMMGMKVDNTLKASFILISGNERGKKFVLERPQVMFGSDSGCDFRFEGRNIPPRYAIVVNRNGEFYAGPLSASPIIVNGEELEGSEEVKLNRGDVLEIGEYKLRFVAPGEVFTLKEDIADRVIDRPKSKTPKILATVAILGVVLCGTILYLYRQGVISRDRQSKIAAEAKKKKQRAFIDELRQQGDEFFANDVLIEPVDNNARQRFEQIIELDPEDSYAKRRLAEIDERVHTLAEQNARRRQFSERIAKLVSDGEMYFKKGNFISPPGSNARDSFQEALRLDPTNDVAQKRLAEINKALSDLVGQVAGWLQRAKDYTDMTQYVNPPGQNAKEMIDLVLGVDPANVEAKNLLIEMAARAIMDGDAARAALNPDGMKKSFLEAQALGVDPDFIQKKLQGIDTIKRSKGDVVIIDTSKAFSDSVKKNDAKYLNMEEIQKRINILQVQGYSPKGKEKRLFEINKK